MLGKPMRTSGAEVSSGYCQPQALVGTIRGGPAQHG